ncbi:MAG: CoB--CoM heterodisulfide reductase iron-sulfur subunit A family protein [Desulfurococcales archaeon]|nr:CoB--CoM heterodisulfide reductase iron-sulfur subunit A family protein [Desulfurococcales archaeon]
MSEEIRIGVYICHCGTNIAGTVDVEEVAKYASTLPNVVVARNYVFMCSEPGQQMIKDDIKKYNLNRIVVAACSPSLHELTFRNVLKEAGLNPYLFEMANIREHCSWAHIDRRKATEKAKDLVRMAVAKARELEPLEEIKVEVSKKALVIGGGVAGLRAALDLARAGFTVYLVEKRPVLGGHTARIPLIRYLGVRGDDLIRSIVKELVSLPNVKIFTNSEVISLEGGVGGFKAKIRVRPRYVDARCTLCRECEKVCPVKTSNEYEYGIGERKAIYLPYEGCYPSIYVIDPEICTRCGECVKICPVKAVDLDEKERFEEVVVGTVILATGFDPYEPEKGELGYKLSDRVITLFQLQRILDEKGPTKGKLVVNGGVPRSIVFISCVGSMGTSPRAGRYCSRMCCSTIMSSALRIRDILPDSYIYILHKDIRTYGYDEDLYWRSLERGVRFVRYEEMPEVKVSEEKISVIVRDVTIGDYIEIPADLVVLGVGMAQSKYLREVLSVVRVSCGDEGFVKEAHPKLRPVDAASEGIYLAGAVTGPKSVIESVIHGSAAAARASTVLSKDYVFAEPIIAKVDEDLCSGCLICIGMCPYNAISVKQLNDRRVANVNPVLCMGCGTCAAACPSGAMQQQGFKDIQIFAQIKVFSR